MKLSIYLLPVLLTILVASCFDNNDDNDNEESFTITNCCEIAAIDAAVGDGHIFVPNIFTPNSDGINDLFFAFSSSNIALIKRFKVTTTAGNLAFESVNTLPNDFSKAWDGTINGEYQKGLFSISIEVEANDGTVETLVGKVCCLPCGNDATSDPIFDAIDNCIFATQHDGLGSFDSSISSLETLPCLD